MSREELRSLTEDVRTLRLQVENIKQELRRRDRSPPSRNTPVATPDSHQQLHRRDFSPPSSDRTTTATTPRNISPLPTPQYKVGDKVIITNRIPAPIASDAAPGWNPSFAKQATVTKVTPSRVYLRTRYGINTWRAPGNVTPA
jgi:hypothetical protein